MCEYIPMSRSKECMDTRSSELVLAFKNKNMNMHDSAVMTVAKALESALSGPCALAAIPPSKTSKNYKTSVHELITRIVADIGVTKNITDASDCLYRKCDIESQHKKAGKRDESTLIESTGIQNVEKIKDIDVLVIDDVTTSGNSLNIAEDMLLKSGAKSVVKFSVGKTLKAQDLKIGFIIDLDGTLFPTDEGDIKFNRQKRDWEKAIAEAEKIEPHEYAAELINKINGMQADYRIVTSSPANYANTLIKKLNIPEEKLIAYHDTKRHKPNIEPYMKAKQSMKIYDPFIITIGNEETDIIPASRLGMTSVLISSNKYTTSLADFKYKSLEACYNNFKEILKPVLKHWDALICNDYERNHTHESIKCAKGICKEGES